MSIRKVVAGLLITAGIAIMAVPFFWCTTGERNTNQLINEFEQTLEEKQDERTEVEKEQTTVSKEEKAILKEGSIIGIIEIPGIDIRYPVMEETGSEMLNAGTWNNAFLLSGADIRRRQMNKRYRLGEIEEAVSEMEELIDTQDDIAEIDDDFQIVVSGWSVYVESLNLTLRQGIACVWDAEEGLFMPDFDVTIVYEGNIETQEWLYYEQDGMVVTLGNWLNGRLSCEQIEQLWCELIIPEQNKEQKESEE